MKIYYTIILLFLLIFLSCKEKGKKPSLIPDKEKPNMITFIFNSRTYKQDTLFFKTGGYSIKNNPSISYSIKHSFDQVTLSPKNYNKSDTINITANSDIYLDHRYHFYYNSSYIFKPGDSVIFEYKNDAPFCTILNRNISDQGLNFEVNYNLLHKVYTDTHKLTKPERKEYFDKLKSNLVKQDNLLDSLDNLDLISKQTYSYLKEKIRYRNAILSFPKTDSLKIDLQNDSLLKIESFRHFISYFTNQKFKIKLLKQSNGATLNYKTAFDSVNSSNLFSYKIKSYLLYSHLKQIAQNFSVEDTNIYLNKFKESINDTLLINEIKNTFLLDFTELKKETKDVFFINRGKKKEKFIDIIDKNKSKLIYIDFWASWCAPCRAAMPSSLKLKADYKNKDVVFIYVSIDKDFNKWEKASKEEGLLLSKNNVLAINYPNANFYKDLKLKTIPRYLLYDRTGILIHQNAPGPDSKEIRVLIDEMLKE